MRFSTAAFLATTAILAGWLLPSAAMAQLATGNEISVNPLAASGQVLLYPGGQYMRVVRPLAQPGQKPADSGVIALHMPSKNPPRVAAQAAAPRRVAVAAPPKPAPAPRAARPAAANNFNPGAAAGAAGLLGNLSSVPAAPGTQIAKAEPVPNSSAVEPGAPGLSKRSVILFAAGSSDPAQSALGSIKFLAGDLNSAMTGAGSRVQLIAYGGGDKGSDARRLSLKRALAIRQVLIDDGVPSERIDVRAMGGADDGGPADRVDVYVKA